MKDPVLLLDFFIPGPEEKKTAFPILSCKD